MASLHPCETVNIIQNQKNFETRLTVYFELPKYQNKFIFSLTKNEPKQSFLFHCRRETVRQLFLREAT